MKAFLFFLFGSINHGDFQGDTGWHQKGAADESSRQTCQQILICTGQVGIGLIAMVTGRVHVPSSPPTVAESWCWFVQPVPSSIWISFMRCWIESARDITPPKQHSTSPSLCLSHFSIISHFLSAAVSLCFSPSRQKQARCWHRKGTRPRWAGIQSWCLFPCWALRW